MLTSKVVFSFVIPDCLIPITIPALSFGIVKDWVKGRCGDGAFSLGGFDVAW